MSKDRLNFLRGLSLTPPTISMVLLSVSGAADLAELLNSSGFKLNLVFIVVAICLNFYIQYWLKTNIDDINKKENTSNQRIRRRAYQKKETIFLRRMSFALVLVLLIGLSFAGYITYRYINWVIFLSKSDNTLLIRPNVLDNLMDTDTFDAYELGDVLFQNDSVIFLVSMDSSDPLNKVLIIRNYSNHFPFLEKVYASPDLINGYMVSSWRMKVLDPNLDRWQGGLVYFDMIRDGDWHQITYITSNSGRNLYVDGHLLEISEVEASWSEQQNIASILVMPIAEGILIDDIWLWETTRDVISEIENQ